MALQDLNMMLPSRLGCPLSLKTPNMGNPGLFIGYRQARRRVDEQRQSGHRDE